MERCGVCSLETKLIRIGEALLRLRVSLRDTVALLDFYVNRDAPPEHRDKLPSVATWDRHKTDGHFSMEDKPIVMSQGQPVLDLDEYVDKMWTDYQQAHGGKPPTEAALMKWLELRAKVRNDVKSREEEKRLRDAISGAAPEV